MTGNEATERRVHDLFAKHIRSNRMLDEIGVLNDVLPDDPAILRGLAARCLGEGQKAIRAGHHMEGRRLYVLGRQLQRRARQKDARKRD